MHFFIGVNPWFSSKIRNFFLVCFSLKKVSICNFMILFMEKKAFQTMKISFSYSQKICIFRKELTYDFGQKFEISF